MPSVRIVRLLASTALVVLLAGAASVLAQTAETGPGKAPALSDKAAAESSPVDGTATAAPVAKFARFDRPARGSDCGRAGGNRRAVGGASRRAVRR